MTRRDLARLFVKVFGLLLLLQAVIRLPVGIYRFGMRLTAWDIARVAYDSSHLVMAAIYDFAPSAIYAVLGVSLIWWSGRIVDRANRTAPENQARMLPADLKYIETSLVAVIGLYFFVEGFIGLCEFGFSQSIVYSASHTATLKDTWTNVTIFQIPTLLEIVTRMTIGVALVLGRGAMVALLHRARHWVKTWRAWPYAPEE